MYQTSIRNKKKHTKFNKDKEVNYIIDKNYEEYAYVLKLLGNCRVKIMSNSGAEAIGIIRGSLRKFNKRVLIESGDIVVISKRDYQDNKVDIIHKFNPDQCHNMIKNNELSKIIVDCYYNKLNDNTVVAKEDINCLNFDNILINSGDEFEFDEDDVYSNGKEDNSDSE